MPTGDSRNPRQPTNQSSGDSTNPKIPDPQPGDAASKSQQDVDFGSYVSSTVRSSAELFGTPARAAGSRSNRSAKGTASQSTPAGDDGADVAPPRTTSPSVRETTDRSSRYWRDTVEPDDSDQAADSAPPAAAGGFGGMESIRVRFPWAFDDGGRPTLPVLGGIAAIALILLFGIWQLASSGGNDSDLTATETPEMVIGAPTEDAGTTGSDSTPSGFVPAPTTVPTDEATTTAPVRGGDNQRNPANEPTPGANGVDPLAGIELGPVALSCPERCLVRFAGGSDAENILEEARTRASFAADGWYWAIAEPEGIAWLEQNGETILIDDSDDTLALYMAQVPSEELTGDRASSIGDVLDSAGNWRLVRTYDVPANVQPLTDWGYMVYKVAPAPSAALTEMQEPTSIDSIEIGSLLDDVSEDNIQQSMTDLIAMGSTDGTGVGSRYYTTGGNMQAAEYLFGRLESYGLKVWYEDFITWDGLLVVNVIGEVAGQDPSEIYGVMAHFDTIADNISVSPGADDNSTGVAASLEIARILSEYQLIHPVRVVFVNVEEVGIVGSEQFAKSAANKGIPYKGIYNLDSIGAQRQYTYVVLNGSASTKWMSDLYIQLNEAYGLNQTINSMTNEAIVADDNRLRDHGIDAVMVGRELYGQSPYHHTSGDTIDTINIGSVARLAQLTVIALATLAQS